jgi:hypothetical protein
VREVICILPGEIQPNKQLSDQQKKTRTLFMIEGALSQAAIILTTGVFLSGYVVLLGGSDLLVGILNNSVTWASVVAVFSYIIYERMERRKKLLLILMAASRLLVCGAIFLPVIFGQGKTTLLILSIMVIFGNMLWACYGVGFTVWMMGSFPTASRNDFVFKRVFWLRISFTLFTIIMGLVLDWSGKSFLGFFIVFMTSLILSAGDLVIMIKVPESANLVSRQPGLNLKPLAEPFQKKNFRGFLAFAFLFFLATSLSSSFTPVYLIRYMKFDYTIIALVNVITYLAMIVCTRLWGRLDGKKSLTFIIRISALVAIFELLTYGFISDGTKNLIFLAPLFSGIGYSGFNIFVFIYRYELMPERNRTIYEGIFGAIFGLGVLIAPLLGSLIMDFLPDVQTGMIQNSRFQFLYFISFLLSAMTILISFRGGKPTERTVSAGPVASAQETGSDTAP